MLLGPTTAFKNNVSHRDLRPADFCRANVGYFSRAAKLVKAIWHSQRVKARRLGAKGALTGGGVCFWQWFGSRLHCRGLACSWQGCWHYRCKLDRCLEH